MGNKNQIIHEIKQDLYRPIIFSQLETHDARKIFLDVEPKACHIAFFQLKNGEKLDIAPRRWQTIDHLSTDNVKVVVFMDPKYRNEKPIKIISSVEPTDNIDPVDPPVIELDNYPSYYVNNDIQVKVRVYSPRKNNIPKDTVITRIVLPDNTVIQSNDQEVVVDYVIKENGYYSFSATDSQGLVTHEMIYIDKIDRTAPLIKSHGKIIESKKIVEYWIEVRDYESGIKQVRLDDKVIVCPNKNFEFKTVFSINRNDEYILEIQDNAGNKTITNLIVSEVELPIPVPIEEILNSLYFMVKKPDLSKSVMGPNSWTFCNDNAAVNDVYPLKELSKIIAVNYNGSPTVNDRRCNSVVFKTDKLLNCKYNIKSVPETIYDGQTIISRNINNQSDSHEFYILSRDKRNVFSLISNLHPVTFDIERETDQIDLNINTNAFTFEFRPSMKTDNDGNGYILIRDKRTKELVHKILLENKNFTSGSTVLPTIHGILARYNGDQTEVEITIEHESTATDISYRIDKGPWLQYVGPFKIFQDSLIESKQQKITGLSDIVSRPIRGIKTIDMLLPIKPLIKVTYGNDNKSATAEITYDPNGFSDFYRINNGPWLAYGLPVKVTDNCLIEAQTTNQYGKGPIDIYTVNSLRI